MLGGECLIYIKNLYNACIHNKIVINEKKIIKKLKILLSVKWIIIGKDNRILLNAIDTLGGGWKCNHSYNRKS